MKVKTEDVQLAVERDIDKYLSLGGKKTYPFPIEDFALKVFTLDIQYEDFDRIFQSDLYDTKEIYGCLFPDGRLFQGMDKVIVINTNRAQFKIGDQIVPEHYYIKNAERQTIAHEVGHYSKNYTGLQLKLFKGIKLDPLSSIIIYPKNEETYANRYSRLLLIPEMEIRTLITKHHLLGTIDLNTYAPIFTEYFGVTQFMIEIRLNELEIPFINGVYIKRTSRFKGNSYTEEDLLALIDIVRSNGCDPTYYDSELIATTYNKLRNQNRASAPLYMAFWRLMNGYYDGKYPEVFEKRILLNIESNKKTTDNVLKIVKNN